MKFKLCLAALLMPICAFAGFSADDDVLESLKPKKAISKKNVEEEKKAPEAPKAEVVPPAQVQPVPVTPPPVAAAPAKPVQVWVARQGTSLRKTLEEWCRTVEWRVVWEPDDLDYPLPAGRTLEGDFETAVKELLKPYAQARRVPLADGYVGNRVLVITEEKKQ